MSSSLDPVYFGKLPSHGDFVRSETNRPSVRALDDWFQRGLHRAKSRQPRTFKSVFDATSLCCFIFSPHEVPGALIGVMMPSRDQSGRRYPFLIALDAGGRRFRSRQLANVPVQMNAFFEQAGALIRRVVNGDVQPRAISDHLDTAVLQERSDTGPLLEYKRYLRQTPLEQLWKQLWVHPGETQKRCFLKKLLDVLLPLQGRIPAQLSYGLQFPLVAGPLTSPYTTSFWWKSALRLLSAPDITPTCFWTAANDEPSRRPSMLFFLRPPPAGAFSPLFSNEQESDAIYELDGQAPQQDASPPPELPARYEKLVSDKQLTLWNFLHEL